MLASAMLVPLILLVLVLARSWYEEWKTFSERSRLPLPAPARAARARLSRAVASSLFERALSACERACALAAPGAARFRQRAGFRLGRPHRPESRRRRQKMSGHGIRKTGNR